MIVSASRRTDLPAFYTPWLLRRLGEGEVLVPAPRHPHRLSRIPLTPDVVDCLVFWTKNPTPLLPKTFTFIESLFATFPKARTCTGANKKVS